jgi:radical SAM-linked protein
MVHTGVSTFVPKPLTPFQWAPQIGIEETERRQRLIGQRFGKNRAIKFGRHNAKETFLEGLVSRSDRRAGDLIEAAFRRGARFEAWGEHLDFGAWQAAIEETGFDVADALRERSLDEPLPWDHVDIHIPKEWFQEDWKRATELQHAQDCRHSKCHKCGVIDVHRPLCASMLRNSIAGRKEERTWARKPAAAPHVEPDAVQRLRFRVGRVGDARFLAHLELMNAWIRTARRAKLPLVYSRGFHAHARVNFSSALPVAEESTGEYMDVVLHQRVDPADAFARLSAVVPEGLLVLGCGEVDLRAPGMMAEVAGWDFVIHHRVPRQQVETAAWSLLEADALPIPREGKAGWATVDVRPMIRHLRVREDGAVEVGLQETGGKAGKARDIVALLGLPADGVRILRRDVYVRDGEGALVSPSAGWSAVAPSPVASAEA